MHSYFARIGGKIKVYRFVTKKGYFGCCVVLRKTLRVAFPRGAIVHAGKGPGLGALTKKSLAEVGSDALPVEVGVDLVLELG